MSFELNVGKHCNFCLQVDFCPIKCQYCNETYCKDHWGHQNRKCTQYLENLTTCPMCNITFTLRNNEDPNIKIKNHIKYSCEKTQTKLRCRVKKCKKICLIPMVCNSCNKNFCIEHRLNIKHTCITVN